jgi:dTDP-4-dehydrorhamnose reductase
VSEPIAVLVPGGRGQLGSDLVAIASTMDGVGSVCGMGSAELDITDAQAVRDNVASFVDSCDGMRVVVVNAAAYTAVDAAESDRDRAYAVNAIGPGLLAAACGEQRVPLIHLSTDYVFAGDGARPYEVDDPTGPRSVYGRTKLAGERAVLSATTRGYVVRTAWVYGTTGANFVKTIARLQRTHDTVSVVDDQHGSPTWSADLARGLLELAIATDRVPPGVLHCTNAGSTTWYGFARAIFEELGADPDRVRPCTSADFPRPAPRPSYSVLSGASWAAAGLSPLRHWRAALAAAFASAGDAFRTG